MPKTTSDKSFTGSCPQPECISKERITVLRITLAAFAVLILFSLAAAPVSADEPEPWDGTADISWYSGHENNLTYTISTPGQLAGLAELVNRDVDPVNFTGKTITLSADLNLSGSAHTWTPIGNSLNKFEGTFDGSNYNISNLYINDDLAAYLGLFGCTNDSTIKNIELINVNITGSDSVGGLVGENAGGTITNCNVTGRVEGNSFVGGIAGENIGTYSLTTSITNSSAAVTVEGNNYVGGLVGLNAADLSGTVIIFGCYATGAVTGTGTYREFIGGLVGANYAICDNDDSGISSITNSYSTGNVIGNKWVGGLVGANCAEVSGGSGNPSASISNSYSAGNVTGNDYVGGLVGANSADFSGGSGNPSVPITNSTALNQFVNSTGTNVSRVVGYNGGTISYNYAWKGMKVNDTFVQGGAHNNVKGEDAESVDVWDNISAYIVIIPDFNTNWRLSTNVNYKLPLLKWQSEYSAAGFNAVYLKPFVITFDSNGGSSVNTQNITKGFKAVEPSDPTRIGYLFENWYKDSTLYDFDTVVTGDITLHANWTANEYNVTVIAPTNGTLSSNKTSSVHYNEEITLTVTPDTGYELDTLTVKDEDNNDVPVSSNKFNMPANNVTVNATFRLITTPIPTATGTLTPSPTQSSGGSTDTGSGNYKIYERSSTDGGIISFGTSPYIVSVELPKGSNGKVVLTIISDIDWIKDETSEYLFDIEVTDMADGTAKINFRLPKNKLDTLGIDYTYGCIYHEIDGVWVKLKTELLTVGENGYIYYTSYTDSFSPFKIVFEENGATEVSQPAVTAVVPTAEPVSTYVEPTKTAVPTAEPTKSPVGLFGLGLGLLGAFAILRRK